MKRHVLSIPVVLLLLAASAGAQEARPDFSGKWVLDAAKSDFGPSPPPEFLIHVIEHKEPNIKIVTSQKSMQGETTNERNLTTDGKDNTNKMRLMGGEQEVKSSSRWDGGKLATTMKFDVQGSAVELNDTWELSDGGKVLTIVRAVKTPQGDFTVKTVFNKQ
jgi:hypothetical protein